jgi:MFS superfamily sulfate permease-like transporter
MMGCALLLASTLRLGFLADFISSPVLTRFKAGIAVVIIVDPRQRTANTLWLVALNPRVSDVIERAPLGKAQSLSRGPGVVVGHAE